MPDESNLLTELTKLTKDELQTFMASGAFTGFTAQEMSQANDGDRGKMAVFNEALRLMAVAKRLNERRRNLGK
jgi:hypothetical protein